jgi:L-fuconolactonase
MAAARQGRPNSPASSPSGLNMDIVDTQLHVGRDGIDATLEAMDALGIRSVLIDEFWGHWDSPDPTHIQPGYALPNGAWRAAWPTAEEGSILHPDRFSYLVRIDRRDPQLESVMRVIGSSPHARAFRLQPVWTQAEATEFMKGNYDPLFDIAQDIGLPVCLFIPGHVEFLPHYARRYPKLRFLVDHIGMGFPNIPPGRSPLHEQRVLSPTYLDEVLKLAEHPNIYLKWAHAQDRFATPDYPYEPLRPLLRRAITAFGADRILWASDKSVMFGHNWSDILHAVRDSPDLSADEKQWILGGTARRVLDWSVPPPPPAGPPHH